MTAVALLEPEDGTDRCSLGGGNTHCQRDYRVCGKHVDQAPRGGVRTGIDGVAELLTPGGPQVLDGGWHGSPGPGVGAYDHPTREVLPIAGLVAFYNEKVDVVVDGVQLERATTHFFPE